MYTNLLVDISLPSGVKWWWFGCSSCSCPEPIVVNDNFFKLPKDQRMNEGWNEWSCEWGSYLKWLHAIYLHVVHEDILRLFDLCNGQVELIEKRLERSRMMFKNGEWCNEGWNIYLWVLKQLWQYWPHVDQWLWGHFDPKQLCIRWANFSYCVENSIEKYSG